VLKIDFANNIHKLLSYFGLKYW